MPLAKLVMRKFYRQADGDPHRLPWHHETPSGVLVAAVRDRGGRGRALDVGCGAGVFSVWLAQQGMDVTGIDLFPEAIAMAEANAREKGVRANFIATDLFTYEPERPFDLVFDSGCLHALVGGNVAKYKRQLLRWLAPDGDYVLAHWGKRNAFDWHPIGPRRRSESTIRRLLAPELRVIDTEVTTFPVPRAFGGNVKAVAYRCRRA